MNKKNENIVFLNLIMTTKRKISNYIYIFLLNMTRIHIITIIKFNIHKIQFNYIFFLNFILHKIIIFK